MYFILAKTYSALLVVAWSLLLVRTERILLYTNPAIINGKANALAAGRKSTHFLSSLFKNGRKQWYTVALRKKNKGAYKK